VRFSIVLHDHLTKVEFAGLTVHRRKGCMTEHSTIPLFIIGWSSLSEELSLIPWGVNQLTSRPWEGGRERSLDVTPASLSACLVNTHYLAESSGEILAFASFSSALYQISDIRKHSTYMHTVFYMLILFDAF
jgi:hypothetical protein